MHFNILLPPMPRSPCVVSCFGVNILEPGYLDHKLPHEFGLLRETDLVFLKMCNQYMLMI
jgi:hypothetical protein